MHSDYIYVKLGQTSHVRTKKKMLCVDYCKHHTAVSKFDKVTSSFRTTTALCLF